MSDFCAKFVDEKIKNITTNRILLCFIMVKYFTIC